MLKNRKYNFVVQSIYLLIVIICCGCNTKSEDSGITVTEPHSIVLFFEKKHSGKLPERRLFEVDTKRQFDRLVNKYKTHYDQNDCIYQFDKEFFKVIKFILYIGIIMGNQ